MAEEVPDRTEDSTLSPGGKPTSAKADIREKRDSRIASKERSEETRAEARLEEARNGTKAKERQDQERMAAAKVVERKEWERMVARAKER